MEEDGCRPSLLRQWNILHVFADLTLNYQHEYKTIENYYQYLNYTHILIQWPDRNYPDFASPIE